MRLERGKPRQLPAEIGQWGTSDARTDTDEAVDMAIGEHVEGRLWLGQPLDPRMGPGPSPVSRRLRRTMPAWFAT
jgi:hypothetical protein